MPPPQHVLLNALFLAPGASGGPETYLRGLLGGLARTHPDLKLTIATTRSGADALRSDGSEQYAEVLALPCEDGQRLRRQWAEQELLPRAAARCGAELVHSLASIAPLRPRMPAVVTLHDVTFMLRPTFGRVTTWGMSKLVTSAAERADGLIAVSAAARDEICAVLGVDPSRITVIHHGHEPTRQTDAEPVEQVRARYRLGDSRVVLCVAAKRPHKNQALLIRALPLLPADVVLVLAGHAEPYEHELRQLAGELGVEERVRFLDYVSDAELGALWSLAACAAFPTLGEGFGIPVLEALAHGVAVAASDLPVLREVGGEVPHWLDPHDPASAARAIEAALGDTDAARTGPERAAGFTWDAAAQATCEVYERVLAQVRR